MRLQTAMQRQKLRSEIEALEPLASEVLALVDLGEHQVTTAALSSAIGAKSHLTRAVLREANAHTTRSAEVLTSVEAAIERVGARRTVLAIVSAAVEATMDVEAQDHGLTRRELWQHSVSAAHIAVVLDDLCPFDLSPSLPIAALLHDVGVVFGRAVQHRWAAPKFIRVAAHAVDHAQLGAEAVHRWGFGTDISGAIRNHHTPFEHDTLTAHGVSVASEVGEYLLNPGGYNYPDYFFDSVSELGLSLVTLQAESLEALYCVGIFDRSRGNPSTRSPRMLRRI